MLCVTILPKLNRVDLLRLKAVFSHSGIHAFSSLEIIKTLQTNFVLKKHFLRELNTSNIKIYDPLQKL